jgi:hypothetical protein
VFFFKQQDLADPTHGEEKFNYGRGSQQEEPPIYAPYLPQGSHTLARKAGKKRVLGLYAAALKRKQDKESKAKLVKSCTIKAEDSSSSGDSISVNNLEKPIPRKNANKFRVAKVDSKVKSTKKADKKKDNKEIDIGFLSAVKKMQIEDDYEMLDSNDDVLSLDDDEISISSADV